MAEFRKGKDPECLLYDCPHKKELEMAMDENTELNKKNEELNLRLESVDNLIEQGLVDIKGIITEIFKGSTKIEPEKVQKVVEKIESVFDTQKITDIVNDNLRLRKELHIREIKMKEQKQENLILRQEKEALHDTLKVREEKDIESIKAIRNMDKQGEEQLKTINENSLKIKYQEASLKVLENFIVESRSAIKGMKDEHEYLLKENKALKSPKLTKEGRRVLKLIKRLKSLKNGSKLSLHRLLPGDKEFKAKVVFMGIKVAYFNLAEFEKQKIVEKYDEVARMMGE